MNDDNRPQGDVVAVFRAATQVEAHSFVLFLASRGIRAIVHSDTYQAPVSIVALEFAIQSQVLVNEEDRQKAEQALVEFQKLTRHADEIKPDPKDDLDEPHLHWKEWPRCPKCSCLRIVECPTCGEAGDDFSLSEYQEEETPLQPTKPKPVDLEEEVDEEAPVAANRYPILLCPQCSEVFRPVFYRRCAHCAHVFADGKEAPPVEPKEKFRWSPIVALVGLVVAVAAIAYAFYVRTQLQQ